MARADNSAFLAQANARRRQAALAAARHAIEQLQCEGKTINYTVVALSAGVSRTWLYSQDQTRDLMSQLRQQHTRYASRSPASSASSAPSTPANDRRTTMTATLPPTRRRHVHAAKVTPDQARFANHSI